MDLSPFDVIQRIVNTQPVAALATLHSGEPATSMVPYALLPDASGLVIHVSRLAKHTGDMLAHPTVSLLLMALPDAASTPLALPRLSIQGEARVRTTDDATYAEARASYLARFPEAEDMFAFGDFSLVVITLRHAHLVAGFGRAHAISAEAFSNHLAR